MKKIILSVFILLILAIPVLAEDVNQVVAVVEGKEITLGQLDQIINLRSFLMQLYQTNPQFTQLLLNTESGQELIKEYRKQQLEQYIMKMLLVMEAKNRGLSISKERENEFFEEQVQQVMKANNLTKEQLIEALKQQGIGSMDEYKKLLLEQSNDFLLIEELQNQVFSEITVDDTEISEYYLNHLQQFEREASVHIRHILVKTKEEAEMLKNKLQNGADFKELAKEFSIGPSASRGGDIGFLTKGELIPEIDEVAFSLQPGEISDVVETELGYHIIKVEEVLPAGKVPLEEAKGQIKELLLDQKKQKAWNQFIQELRENAQVEIKI
ncbi:peptidylprolyl isomerase [Anoxybacter fermentans]|uniref:Peptidylprolyl isomerase n=1 Tax=Anoxybacter fermentans TaxID=1323375 RepID=A0A3Q9HNB2_9FIRM|nr:peptidyl-prolyl cis-trans isomerase [Anoxybacter fermentans]AZR71972.1 peptidylprolyl isomerase [Anoxybacter fermentans]